MKEKQQPDPRNKIRKSQSFFSLIYKALLFPLQIRFCKTISVSLPYVKNNYAF